MKSYSVAAEAPAMAFWVVEAETEEDAIRQIKNEIAEGKMVDFEVSIQDMDDPGDVDFFAVELDGEECETAKEPAALIKYTVVLDGIVRKKVSVNAASPDAALDLVDQLCETTGLLHFCGDDVIELTTAVDEPERDPVQAILLEMLRHIRSSNAPDEVLAQSLQAGLNEAITKGEEQ